MATSQEEIERIGFNCLIANGNQGSILYADNLVNRNWLPAIHRDGQFFDANGLRLAEPLNFRHATPNAIFSYLAAANLTVLATL